MYLNIIASTEGGTTMPSITTSTVAPSQETIGEKTAELAHKMNMETWQLVAILVGKIHIFQLLTKYLFKSVYFISIPIIII